MSAAAWPVNIVNDGGRAVGFLMPPISSEFRVRPVLPSGKRDDVEAELQHLLNPDEFLVRRGLTVTLADKFQILRETADLLLWLHGEGIAVGDLSAKNVLYSVNPYPRTFLIDCDSMALQGESVGDQLETPGWDVRSVSQEPLGTAHSDAYKFGLIALRLLAGDQFTRDPMRAPDLVPRDVRDLIVRSLSSRPDQRPGLYEWTRPLATAARMVQASVSSAPTKAPPQVTNAALNQQIPVLGPSAQGRRPASKRPLVFGGIGVVIAAIVGAQLMAGGGRGSDDAGESQVDAREVATFTDPTVPAAQPKATSPGLASTKTPVPQPTLKPTPAVNYFVMTPASPGGATARADTLDTVGAKNHYSYTVTGEAMIQVYLRQTSLSGAALVITTPDGHETGLSAMNQCFSGTNTLNTTFAGLNGGGDGVYSVMVYSGCNDSKALGAYEIVFKSCGARSRYFNECSTRP